MKKTLLFAAIAAMLFTACGNNNTKTNTNNQQAQNEPVVEETVAEEAVAEEPAAPETTTWDHYEWTMTIPNDGWKVSNAYSDMGIDYLEDWSHFNIKSWEEDNFEEFLTKYPQADRFDNIVTDNYTWIAVNTDKNTSYKVSFYTYDPNRKMAVRVGSEDIADPTDERVLTVLKGFAFKPVE